MARGSRTLTRGAPPETRRGHRCGAKRRQISQSAAQPAQAAARPAICGLRSGRALVGVVPIEPC
eukprot:11181389-Lingulodinium_polyedra.AAC.1